MKKVLFSLLMMFVASVATNAVMAQDAAVQFQQTIQTLFLVVSRVNYLSFAFFAVENVL